LGVNIYSPLAEVSREFRGYGECEEGEENDSMVLEYISSGEGEESRDEDELEKFDLEVAGAIVEAKKRYSKDWWKIPEQEKSKTGFLGSKFYASVIPNGMSGEVRLSRRFELRDMLGRSMAKKKSGEVEVNAVYKRKADKIKPVDLGKSTGEKPEVNSRWFRKAWEEVMACPEKMGGDPPHRYDAFITPRFSGAARGSRLTPERVERLKFDEALLPNEKEFLLEILYRREHCLAWDFSELKRVRPEVFPPQKIKTVEHEAWQCPAFPLPKKLIEVVIEMLKKRIDAGILEPCDGPYRNPWFLVKKKSGAYRMVIAAMKMNGVTVRDANMPPDPDEFAEDFAGMSVSSILDYFSGYDNFPSHEESRDMTAIATPLGLLRQTTLLQGATNSVAQCQRASAAILERNIPHDARVYIDDIPVRGPKTRYGDEETLPGVRRFIFEHLKTLDRVLVSIELSNVKVSGEKSQFCQPGIIIVGFSCDFDGRRPEAGKVAKIANWPACRNITEARAFIGVCVYYRIWIKDFATIAQPIYVLFKKGHGFVWGEAQVKAMEILKIALTSAPALKSIDYEPGAGTIYCGVDASGDGWGGNLMQEERGGRRRHAIRYESGIWSDAERKYDAGKRECMGVLKMLKKCKRYIYEVHFVLEIDANTLVAQLNRSATDLPGAVVTRWIAWIRLFDFDVRHVPGKKHTAADGLSRRPQGEGETEDEEDIDDWLDTELGVVRVATSEIEEEEGNILEPGYSEEHQKIAWYLATLKRPDGMNRSEFRNFKRKALQFFTQEGHLFRRQRRNVPLQRVVDQQSERDEILRSLHDESGHRGREGTWRKIAERYWWEGLYDSVKEYVKKCPECQFRDSKRRTEELYPTYGSMLWEKVAIDITHMPMNQGKKYIIEARDDLSGWPEARALAKATAANVAKFIYEEILMRHSCPLKIVVDGGPENKDIVDVLLKRYKVKRIQITAYHPQANGMIEVGHRPIANALSKMTKGGTTLGAEGWVAHLPAVLMAERTTVRVSTEMTPFHMLYGYDAVLPIELDVPTWQTLPWNTVRERPDLISMRARQIERRDEDIEEAMAHLQRMRIQGKEQYDRMRDLTKDPPKKEDLVLLHNSKLNTSYSAKLKFRWSGPYRVKEIINDKGTYKLEELDGTPLKHPVHGNRLKKFWLRDESFRVVEEDEGSAQENQSEMKDPATDEDEIQDDNNAADWIPPGRSFAVVI